MWLTWVAALRIPPWLVPHSSPADQNREVIDRPILKGVVDQVVNRLREQRRLCVDEQHDFLGSFDSEIAVTGMAGPRLGDVVREPADQIDHFQPRQLRVGVRPSKKQ